MKIKLRYDQDVCINPYHQNSQIIWDGLSYKEKFTKSEGIIILNSDIPLG